MDFPSIAGLIHHVEVYEHGDNPPYLHALSNVYPEDGEQIRKWNDQTGIHTYFDHSGNQWFRQAEHAGVGSVEFDASNGYFATATVGYDVPLTVFMVFAQTVPVDENFICKIKKDAGPDNWMIHQVGTELHAGVLGGANLVINAAVDTDYHIVSATLTGDASAKIRFDGTQQTGDMGGMVDSVSATIAANSNNTLHAEMFITAWIVYDRALNDQEIGAMEHYLDQQYSIGRAMPEPPVPADPPTSKRWPEFRMGTLISKWHEPGNGVRDATDDFPDDGEEVLFWHDTQPANNNFESQDGGGFSPPTWTREAINGKGALESDATDQILEQVGDALQTPPSGTEITVGIVFKVNTAPSAVVRTVLDLGDSQLYMHTDSRLYWGADNNGAGGDDEDGAGLDPGMWRMATLRQKDTASSLRQNAQSYGTGTNGADGTGGWKMTVGGPLDGVANNVMLQEVAFICMFDEWLEEDDHQRLEWYMDQQYFNGLHQVTNPDEQHHARDFDGHDPPTNRYFHKHGGQGLVGGSTPDNGNDGRDPLGFGLVNATYDHTGHGEGERHLSKVGQFATYEHVPNDRIYLMNAVGGVATGLYTIAARVGDDAILLEESNGLTADASGVDSSTGAWSGIAKLTNWAGGAGSCLIHCRDREWGRTRAVTSVLIGSGTALLPLTLRSADSRGVEREGIRANIGGNALTNQADPMWDDGGNQINYWEIEGFCFDHGGSGRIIELTNSASCCINFRNCEFCNTSAAAIFLTDVDGPMSVVDCDFHDVGNICIGSTADRGRWTIMNCWFDSITSHGLWKMYDLICINNVFTNIDGIPIAFSHTNGNLTVVGNTFINSTVWAALYLGNSEIYFGTISNNIVHDCEGGFIEDNGSVVVGPMFNNIVSDLGGPVFEDVNYTGQALSSRMKPRTGYLDIIPRFYNEVPGEYDPRPRADSGFVNQGLLHSRNWIGGSHIGSSTSEWLKQNVPMYTTPGVGIQKHHQSAPRSFNMGLTPVSSTDRMRYD